MATFRETSIDQSDTPVGPAHWHAEHAGSPDVPDGEAEDQWSVPWSDLMMVMFVIFAALFSLEVVHNVELMQAQQARSQV